MVKSGTKLKLVKADTSTPLWEDQIGRIFTVGEYSEEDGNDCVWLINERGEYEQTIDQASVLEYFEVTDGC
jgi:hypothetical protein